MRLVAVLALVLLAPASAFAADGWYGPETPPVKGGSDPQLGRTADGRTFLLERTAQDLRLSTRPDGGRWTQRRLLAAPVGGARLVVDGDQVTALWSDGSGVGARRVDADSAGEAVATGPASDLQAVAAPGGGIEVAWIAGAEVRSARRGAGWVAQIAVPFGPPDAVLSDLRLAALAGGGAIFAVRANGIPYAAVRAETGGSWTVTKLDLGVVGDLSLGVDSLGTAVVAFIDETSNARVATRATGSVWTAPVVLAGPVSDLQIAGGVDGRMAIGYVDAASREVRAVRRSGSAFGAPSVLATAPRDGGLPILWDIALSDGDVAYALITVQGGGDQGMLLTDGTSRGTFSGTQIQHHSIWAQGGRLLVAVGDQVDFLYGLDRLAPTITSASVPATVAAGVPATLSLQARDDESGVRSAGWQYGAGPSEQGASQRHVFPRPGRFRVTAFATDSAGNSTLVTRIVTVVPLARALATPLARSARAVTVRISCLVSPLVVGGTVSIGAVRMPFLCSAAGRATVRLRARAPRGTLVTVSAIDATGAVRAASTKLT